MQLSLNIGTIDIRDREVVNFIQNKSVEEIKNLIIEFFRNKAHTKTVQKGKWGAFADRMSGLTTPEITAHIQKTSQDFRDGVEIRDLIIKQV